MSDGAGRWLEGAFPISLVIEVNPQALSPKKTLQSEHTHCRCQPACGRRELMNRWYFRLPRSLRNTVSDSTARMNGPMMRLKVDARCRCQHADDYRRRPGRRPGTVPSRSPIIRINAASSR